MRKAPEIAVEEDRRAGKKGLIPGIPWTVVTPSVQKGASLILRTPLGEIIFTTMQDIEMISYRPDAKRLQATPILLPKDIHKFDIPIGTEVYLASDTEEQKSSEQDETQQPPLAALSSTSPVI